MLVSKKKYYRRQHPRFLNFTEFKEQTRIDLLTFYDILYICSIDLQKYYIYLCIYICDIYVTYIYVTYM